MLKFTTEGRTLKIHDFKKVFGVQLQDDHSPMQVLSIQHEFFLENPWHELWGPKVSLYI